MFQTKLSHLIYYTYNFLSFVVIFSQKTNKKYYYVIKYFNFYSQYRSQL